MKKKQDKTLGLGGKEVREELKNEKAKIDKAVEKKKFEAEDRILKETGKKKSLFKKISTQLGPKITLSVCAAIVPLLLAVLFAASSLFKGDAKEMMTQQTDTTFKMFESKIALIQSNLQSSARSLAMNMQVTQALAGKSGVMPATTSEGMIEQAFLSQIPEDERDHYYAACYTTSGEALYTHGSIPSGIDIPSTVGGVSSGGYITDVMTPLSLYIALPVQNMNGELLGGIVMGFDLACPTIVDEVHEITGNHVTVFAGDTRISTSIVAADGTRVTGTQMDPSIASAVLTQGQWLKGEGRIVNENMIYEYSPLVNAYGTTVGALFAGCPTTNLDKTYFQTAISLFIAALVICIACLWNLARVIKKSISKPINKVIDLAKKLRDGDLHSEPVEILAHNETRELADMMNETVANLNLYIGDITHHLAAMANKDLTQHSNVDYKGDFMQLRVAVRDIRADMRGFIDKMEGASGNVSTNSELIANSAQTVATGTTEQAATIEELSSTILEVSKNVERNAANAEDAQKLSGKVNSRIDDQNKKMDELRAAMDDIEKRSGDIQKIIKTIDDIAFQTNILALNAAVEAARAGEAGKGFAVVADEVRNLASKSAEAAKDTTGLIQATISSVQSGAGLVQAAADSLTEVVRISADTNDLIDNISNQSQEQALAIRQITEGIDQINNVIQSNSAVAEESSASSEELFAQAKDLQRMVKEYTI